ncbi:MAG: 23S rRNA (uracil(1939)-C(5))-methyltransferase RlmD [Clostridia bacterium]|nr:23S rRNA (uracil(1939)-C(5))-methyltransferase RlmD [Clostridia bacterium]
MKNLECKYFNICGGCKLLNVDYEKQLKQKQQQVEDALAEFNITAKVDKTVGMFYPYKYRNKVHLAIRDVKGKAQVGFFEENSNKIVDVDSCLLHDVWVKKLINIVRDYITKFKVSPYNKRKNEGTLKYVVARCLSDEIMVTMVVTNHAFAGREWFYEELTKNYKNVSFYVNVNTRTDNAVFDEKGFSHKGGFKKLRGEMLGVKFELSPNSFFQINTQITEKIYKRIFESLNLNDRSVVLDLYSGIGITSLIFAKNGAKVVSIESVPEAVNDAKNLIKLNKCENKITPLLGKCENLINRINYKKLYKENGVVSVFLDPPRIGAQVSVLEEINKLNPYKLVYLSCNPKTLARDLKVLTDYGFKLESVTPFDMFPHTNHVETLVVLSK